MPKRSAKSKTPERDLPQRSGASVLPGRGDASKIIRKLEAGHQKKTPEAFEALRGRALERGLIGALQTPSRLSSVLKLLDQVGQLDKRRHAGRFLVGCLGQ